MLTNLSNGSFGLAKCAVSPQSCASGRAWDVVGRPYTTGGKMHSFENLIGPALFFSFVFVGIGLAFYAMFFRAK
jgi:hypothetical protein